jgi:hypothetical protein
MNFTKESNRVLVLVQELEKRLHNRSFKIGPFVQAILESLPRLKFMSRDVPDQAFEFHDVIVKLRSVLSCIDELAIMTIPLKDVSTPDYDSMSLEEMEFHRAEFSREYEGLTRVYPNWSIPVLNPDDLPLAFIHKHRDRLVADLELCKCVHELSVLREALSEYDMV